MGLLLKQKLAPISPLSLYVHFACFSNKFKILRNIPCVHIDFKYPYSIYCAVLDMAITLARVFRRRWKINSEKWKMNEFSEKQHMGKVLLCDVLNVTD